MNEKSSGKLLRTSFEKCKNIKKGKFPWANDGNCPNPNTKSYVKDGDIYTTFQVKQEYCNVCAFLSVR